MVLFGVIVAFSIVIILVCILFFDFYNDDFLLPRMHATSSNIEDDTAEKSIRTDQHLRPYNGYIDRKWKIAIDIESIYL